MIPISLQRRYKILKVITVGDTLQILRCLLFIFFSDLENGCNLCVAGTLCMITSKVLSNTLVWTKFACLIRTSGLLFNNVTRKHWFAFKKY